MVGEYALDWHVSPPCSFPFMSKSCSSFFFFYERKSYFPRNGLEFLLRGSHLAKWKWESSIYSLEESHTLDGSMQKDREGEKEGGRDRQTRWRRVELAVADGWSLATLTLQGLGKRQRKERSDNYPQKWTSVKRFALLDPPFRSPRQRRPTHLFCRWVITSN